MPVTIYVIKTCGTMKKARTWLDKRGVAYAFHDYKTAGIASGHEVTTRPPRNNIEWE